MPNGRRLPGQPAAPPPVIPQVPPGPAPGTPMQPPPAQAPNPMLQRGANAALAPPQLPTAQEAGLGQLSPEQASIVQIALGDPQILAAIAESLGAGATPEQVLFGG